MKKFLSFLLTLCLLLSALPAFAAEGDATLYRREEGKDSSSIESIAYLDGKLYMLSYDGMSVCDLSTNEVTKLPFAQDLFTKANGYFQRYGLITDGENLYSVVVESTYEDDMQTVDGAYLYKFVPGDDAVSAEQVQELDWDDMIEYSDDYEYSREVNAPFMVGARIYFTTYMSSSAVICYDTEDDSLTEYALEGEVNSAFPGRDGKIFYTVTNYGDGSVACKLYELDPETEDCAELCDLPAKGYSYPSCMVYSAADDALYFNLSGELYAMTGLDPATATSIGSVPLDSWSQNQPVLTDDGFYIAYDYETVVKRSTHPTGEVSARLTVYNTYNDAVDGAYFDFTNAHGDVEVILTTQTEDILQAMLNKSSSVDVYCLSVSGAEYAALFKRGYLADLSGSESLSTLAGKMYPFIQNAVGKDGAVYALPIEFNVNARGVNKSVLTQLDLTEDDIPTTWQEYFDLLNRLPEYLPDDGSLTAFEPYYTKESMKQELFFALVQDYMLYITLNPDNYAFDTPLFRSLLDGLESVDFDALGLMSQDDYPDDASFSYRDNTILFTSYADMTPYVSSRAYDPMVLSMNAEMDALMPVDMMVAVVNPYSEHRDLAIQFVESIANRLPQMLLTELSPDYNDPIENAYYEQGVKSYDEAIETYKSQIEEADDADKQALQDQLDELQGYYDYYVENNRYDASPDSIARYRQYAEKLVAAPYFGLDAENSSEFYSLLYQYTEGTITADEMLKGIDQKLQMMMLEGL